MGMQPGGRKSVRRKAFDDISRRYSQPRWLAENRVAQNRFVSLFLQMAENIRSRASQRDAREKRKQMCAKEEKLTKERCQILVKAIKETLRSAIKCGGSSLKDYVNADGIPGYFQQNYNVYNREKLPCKKCESNITKKTYFQRAGRPTELCGFSWVLEDVTACEGLYSN